LTRIWRGAGWAGKVDEKRLRGKFAPLSSRRNNAHGIVPEEVAGNPMLRPGILRVHIDRDGGENSLVNLCREFSL